MLSVLFLFEIARVSTAYVKCAPEYKIELNYELALIKTDFEVVTILYSPGFRGQENTGGFERVLSGGDNTNALEGRIL